MRAKDFPGPTQLMLDLLGKLYALKVPMRVRSQIPRGYEVTALNDKASLTFWFPTVVGRGVLSRGLVDDQGHLTALGKRTIKKHLSAPG